MHTLVAKYCTRHKIRNLGILFSFTSAKNSFAQAKNIRECGAVIQVTACDWVCAHIEVDNSTCSHVHRMVFTLELAFRVLHCKDTHTHTHIHTNTHNHIHTHINRACWATHTYTSTLPLLAISVRAIYVANKCICDAQPEGTVGLRAVT